MLSFHKQSPKGLFRIYHHNYIIIIFMSLLYCCLFISGKTLHPLTASCNEKELRSKLLKSQQFGARFKNLLWWRWDFETWSTKINTATKKTEKPHCWTSSALSGRIFGSFTKSPFWLFPSWKLRGVSHCLILGPSAAPLVNHFIGHKNLNYV